MNLFPAQPQIKPAELARVGQVLLIYGAADIALAIACRYMGIAYTSQLGLCAVVAGLFLERGSLVSALVVRWSSAFAATAIAASLIMILVIQPVSFTVTQLHVATAWFLITNFSLLLAMGLAAWTFLRLGTEPVQVALGDAGIDRPPMRWPALAGAALVIVTSILATVVLHGAAADKAIDLAQQQLGAGYSYRVTSLRSTIMDHVTHTVAVVEAWNADEIKAIPLQWEER